MDKMILVIKMIHYNKMLIKIIYLYIFPIVAMSANVAAQNFPVKPVRFVIGPAPELLPRLVSQKLSELWGHQVVVDPKSGRLDAKATVVLRDKAKAP